MRGKFILLTILLFSCISFTYAQQKKASGIVLSSEDDSPVIGATVLIKGTTIGTVTAADGTFSITEIDASASSLVVSFIGMQSQEVAIGENLKIVLNPDNENLDEVMVVAYGTTKKSAFTGSASVVKTDDMSIPSASFEKGLAGHVAGVQVVSASGQPGSGTSFRIRGTGSLTDGASEPLIVIDGVATSNEEFSQIAEDNSSSSNLLATINPDDIESVTVLKDAAAAALYGSRAANGVILITTKSGSSGKTKVTLNVKYSNTAVAGKYDVMNSAQYYKHLFTGYMNAGNDYATANELTQGQITHNPYNTDYPLDANGDVVSGSKIVVDTDWQDAVFKNAATKDYSLGISGGSEKSTYYFSLGHLDQEGIAPGAHYKRYSGKMNINTEATKWLKVGLNTNFAYSIQNTTVAGSAGASPLYEAIQFPNAVPIYEVDDDGNYVLDDDGNKQFNYTNAVASDFNPLATSYDDEYRTEMYHFIGSAFAEINFLEGLTFKTVFSPDLVYVPEFQYWNKEHGNGAGYNGRIDEYHTTDLMYTSTNTFNYSTKFNDAHSLNVMAGMEYWQSDYKYLYAGGTDLLGDMKELSAASTVLSSSSQTEKEVLISYFGRAEYAYLNKYNVSLSLRTDGSSVFGTDNKWGTFWSAGFSWRLTEENFLKDVSWIDQLKIRTSYGTSGNKSGIDKYASKGLWTVDGDYKYNGSSGSILTQLANDELSWEAQKMLNIGVDFSFFNRFYGSFDYFNKTSDGLLYEYPISVENGLDDVTLNAAKTANHGVEIVLGTDIFRRDDFRWNIEINASVIQDEIKDLYGDDDVSQTDYSKIWSVGGSQYEFWMPTWAGVDSSNGDPLWYTIDEDGKRVTTNDYDEAEYERQGRSTPDVYGGINNTLSYKNFDLSINLAYSIGGKIYDGIYQTIMHDGSSAGSGVNLSADALNSWTTEGQKTDVPLYTINNSTSSNSLSSRFLFDATNVSIKNITLGYTLPKKLGFVSNVVSGCRVFVSADNLYRWFADDWKGFDDIDIYGVQGYSKYPSIPTGRTFSVGAKLTF